MASFNDKDIYKKVDIDVEKKDIDIEKKDIDIKKKVDVDINKKDIDINKKIEVKDNKAINNDFDVTKIDIEKLLKLWMQLYVNNASKQQGENIILTNGNNNEIQIPNEQGPGDVVQD